MGQRVAMKRAGLVAAAVLATVLSVRDGIARVAGRSPAALAIAARIAPDDAGVLTAQAETMLGTIARDGAGDPAAAAALARRAVARELVRVDALSVLGTVAQMRGDRDRAAAIMSASDALGRRDLMTRLWFVDDAIRRGREDEALHHFDLALRTSLVAHRTLFPLLARAMEDSSLVAPMTRLLRRQPAWGADFLYAAIATNRGTRNLAQVYAALDPRPVHPGGDLGQLLVDTLVAQRDYRTAYALDRRLAGSAPRGPVVDPAFAAPGGRTPFAWTLAASAEFDAVRTADPRGGTGLAVTSTGAARGTLAEQLVRLPPGAYAFAADAAPQQPEPGARLAWSLTCAAGNRVLGTRPAASGPPARWTVPADCPFQWLRLTMDATASPTGEEWFAGPVSLRRIDPAS